MWPRKEATLVLGKTTGNSGCKARQHAGQAGRGETCGHSERACALQSAGEDAAAPPPPPHNFVPRRDGQAARPRRRGKTRVCGSFPRLVGVSLLKSISVSWGRKT